MRDYAQYSSRIPSPAAKTVSSSSGSSTTTVSTSQNVKSRSAQSPESDPSSTPTSYRQPPPSVVTPPDKKISLSPGDALQLRQLGAEATIYKFRDALDRANAKDLNSKAAIAKSEAVILELRSSLAKVRAQLETVQADKMSKSLETPTTINELKRQIQDLQNKLSHGNSQNAAVGELQVQLDRAHAQMLTADMVRKELEDTLEAEQYTWELRIKDQERESELLREEISRLQKDLDDARSQWRSAEQDWNKQTLELNQQLTQARTRLAATQAMKSSDGPTEALQIKIQQMEKEKAELQHCLDEALQELEAVDAELQENGKNGDAIEHMKHLLRWIYQEGPSQKSPSFTSRDPKRLLQEIQAALEEWIAAVNKAGQNDALLQKQVEHYQQELKSREDVSGELRESLKEAVALLKPLQAAVATAEEEKRRLQTQLDELQKSSQKYKQERSQQGNEIEKLKAEIVHLQQQVEEQKSLATARGSLLASNAASARSAPDRDDSLAKIQRAREELRRKRETEGNLQQLLKDAQSRFRVIHKQNEDVAARNRELQGQLQQAEAHMSNPTPSSEDQITLLQRQLQDREAQVEQLQQALRRNGHGRIQELDQQLEQAMKDLAAKEQSEHVLNKTLKEAVGLLRPLQMHLEEAEKEKMHISKELRTLRKRFRQLQMSELGSAGDDQSKSTFGGDVSIELIKIKEELEDTVRQLELENSQLHDALEEMPESGNSEAKWRQKLVELNSRYEVTQNKLEDAHVENHALVKEIRKREAREQHQQAEIERLRRRLEQSESELVNAKSIAKTALIKVEQLTANDIEALSRQKSTAMDMGFPLTSTGF
jgi:chromosome segregation ATPase